MSIIEGEIELSWNVVSPLWQRILVSIALVGVLAVLIIGNFQGWFDPPRIVLRSLSLMAFGIIMLGGVELFPKRYHLTNKGLWCTTARIFGNPENPRYKPRRLVWWDDVASLRVQKEKLILHRKLPEQQSSYSLPPWMLHVFKRVEVPLSRRTPELGEEIITRIRSHCPEKT